MAWQHKIWLTNLPHPKISSWPHETIHFSFSPHCLVTSSSHLIYQTAFGPVWQLGSLWEAMEHCQTLSLHLRSHGNHSICSWWFMLLMGSRKTHSPHSTPALLFLPLPHDASPAFPASYGDPPPSCHPSSLRPSSLFPGSHRHWAYVAEIHLDFINRAHWDPSHHHQAR